LYYNGLFIQVVFRNVQGEKPKMKVVEIGILSLIGVAFIVVIFSGMYTATNTQTVADNRLLRVHGQFPENMSLTVDYPNGASITRVWNCTSGTVASSNYTAYIEQKVIASRDNKSWKGIDWCVDYTYDDGLSNTGVGRMLGGTVLIVCGLGLLVVIYKRGEFGKK
jgi:hypothetical protein